MIQNEKISHVSIFQNCRSFRDDWIINKVSKFFYPIAFPPFHKYKTEQAFEDTKENLHASNKDLPYAPIQVLQLSYISAKSLTHKHVFTNIARRPSQDTSTYY